jgi:sugar phosphate isomerase/epimerase
MSPCLGIGLSVPCEDPNWADLGASIDAAAARGCEFAELPLHKLDIIVGGRILKDRLAAVRRVVEGRGPRYTLHGHLGINLMEAPHRLALHRRVLDANIEVASELGCLHLVLHSGFARAGSAAAIEDAYARQREALAAAGDRARALGVVLCVENIFEFTGERVTALPARLARELAAVGHPSVMATFDLSHGYLHCGMLGVDFLEQAKALAPFAKHLHLHDSFGDPDDFWCYTQTERLAFGIGDLHLPMGWGSLPWAAVARDCRFPAGVVGDIELQARYWSELDATIAAARDFCGTLKQA